MVVISMPKITSAYDRLVRDFRDINFVIGDDFHWSAIDRTITHPRIDSEDSFSLLLHEVGHAKLDHYQYSRDIELIDMERQAWEHAVTKLAPQYGHSLAMDDDVVQDALDSYRNWLHARSSCPGCQAIGIEVSTLYYGCLVCQSNWRVNEARVCQLRRFKQ